MKECCVCGKIHEGKGETCSNSCRGKLSNMRRGNGTKWVYKTCPFCKTEFKIKVYQESTRSTCGKASCRTEDMRIKMSGELNPQYGIRGDLNASWKGGRSITDRGYVKLYLPDHPNSVNNYIMEHIMVMSDHLGRPLDTNIECVHHINGVKDDNRIENLELLSFSEHSYVHRKSEGNDLRKRDKKGRFIKSC